MKNQAEICSFSEQFWVAPRRAAFRRADGAPESGSTRAHLAPRASSIRESSRGRPRGARWTRGRASGCGVSARSIRVGETGCRAPAPRA